VDASRPPVNDRDTLRCSTENEEEARRNAISACTVPDWSRRMTGKVSKKAGMRRTDSEDVPKVKDGWPSQSEMMPSDLKSGPDLNKPPLAGLLPR
jgi:hypothetical protein